MGDDLAAFFAKKKSKGTKKKAIRMDDVVQQLESNMRFDREGGEDDAPLTQDLPGNHFNDEDSEWIGYGTKSLHLAGETVGTFNSIDVIDEEVVSDRSERENCVVEKTKTWNIPSKDKEEAPKETVIAAVTTTKSKFEAYKPPTQRSGGSHAPTRRQNVDLRSEEMFPSLGDADKIEKQQTEYQKKQRQEEKVVTPAEPKPEPVREVKKPEPTPTATLPTPAARPTPRVAPPSGNIGTGFMNAKGEWIVLEEPKAEPEAPRREQTSWRSSKIEAAPTSWSDIKEEKTTPRPIQKSNPFGAAKPVTVKLPSVADEDKSWRSGNQSKPQQATYQPPQQDRNDGPPPNERKPWGRESRDVKDVRSERQEKWRRDDPPARREEPVKKEEPVKNWRDPESETADGWSSVSTRRRR